jgi:hypothetical protein
MGAGGRRQSPQPAQVAELVRKDIYGRERDKFVT